MMSIQAFLRGSWLPLMIFSISEVSAQRPMAPAAANYLGQALDTIEAVTIGRDTIAWDRIRDSAFAYAAGAQRPEDTYGAINWALRRANKPSFLQARSVGVVFQRLPGGVGYLRTPDHSTTPPGARYWPSRPPS